MPHILIAGDTCPIGRNQKPFIDGDADALLGDLRPDFDAADLVIANLECPLIEHEAPIPKCGPNLHAPVDCAHGLKAMGVDVACLANNHIMDHGPQGLSSTMRALAEQGIQTVGAGASLDDAGRILVKEVDGLRLGILAMAEHEFGIAETDKPGANPLDVIDFVRSVTAHREEYDRLIVLLHAGNEHFPYPRPELRKTCRFFVEQGADAVICQHSHCVGCTETWNDVPIVYGQGNFLFDMESRYETWCTGALVALECQASGPVELRVIPFEQSRAQVGLRSLNVEETEDFRRNLATRSEILQDAVAFQKAWERFCQERKRYYLNTLHGRPNLFRRVIGKLDLLHYLDRPEKQRLRKHLIRCESHREALLSILDRESRR